MHVIFLSDPTPKFKMKKKIALASIEERTEDQKTKRMNKNQSKTSHHLSHKPTDQGTKDDGIVGLSVMPGNTNAGRLPKFMFKLVQFPCRWPNVKQDYLGISINQPPAKKHLPKKEEKKQTDYYTHLDRPYFPFVVNKSQHNPLPAPTNTELEGWCRCSWILHQWSLRSKFHQSCQKYVWQKFRQHKQLKVKGCCVFC